MHGTRLLVAALAAVSALSSLEAQSNVVPGMNGRLTSISNFTVVGTNATAIGCAAQNDMCNVGTVNIPWYAAGASGQMQTDHPKFGFMVCRDVNGRFEQISDRSFCKHAFVSVNGTGGCGPCQSTGGLGGTVMGIGCTDAYGVGNNADPYWLGPPQEIDPWLGTWNHVGSYFDQGVPNVGAPNNADGRRSPLNITDPVTNRVTILRSDLGLPGATYWYQIHLIHQGEALANRNDNLMTRGVQFTPSGSSWNSADVGGTGTGSILTRWSGATVASANNGNDDGLVFVAVKTTGPTAGVWRFEYAVHNVDYSRGASTFRVPLCAAAVVSNVTSGDIDANPLNDWTWAVANGELVFSAPTGNALEWNTVYNFGFDCTVGPSNGSVVLDQARVGPGASSLSVAARTPAGSPTSQGSVTQLGPGCGSPATTLTAVGVPNSPNQSLSLLVQSATAAPLLFVYSWGTANLALAPGCTQYLAPATLGVAEIRVAGAGGFTVYPLPVPAGLGPFRLSWQVAQLIPGGPVQGNFGVSNGVELVHSLVGGCQ